MFDTHVFSKQQYTNAHVPVTPAGNPLLQCALVNAGDTLTSRWKQLNLVNTHSLGIIILNGLRSILG